MLELLFAFLEVFLEISFEAAFEFAAELFGALIWRGVAALFDTSDKPISRILFRENRIHTFLRNKDQVAAATETRTPTWHRANLARKRVRMEEWRQKRLA